MRSSPFLPLTGPFVRGIFEYYGQFCPGMNWIGAALGTRSQAAGWNYRTDWDMLVKAGETNPGVVRLGLDFTVIFEVDSETWDNTVDQIRITTGGSGSCETEKAWRSHVLGEWEQLTGKRWEAAEAAGVPDYLTLPRIDGPSRRSDPVVVVVGALPGWGFFPAWADGPEWPVEEFTQFIEFNALDLPISEDHDMVTGTSISQIGAMEWHLLVHLDRLDVVLYSRMAATPYYSTAWRDLTRQEWNEVASDEAFRLAATSAADFLNKFLAWVEEKGL